MTTTYKVPNECVPGLKANATAIMNNFDYITTNMSQLAQSNKVSGNITGMEISTTDTILTVAAGYCLDKNYVKTIQLPQTSKTLAPFIEGSGNGGLDAESVAANTFYGICAITDAARSKSDILFSAYKTGAIQRDWRNDTMTGNSFPTGNVVIQAGTSKADYNGFYAFSNNISADDKYWTVSRAVITPLVKLSLSSPVYLSKVVTCMLNNVASITSFKLRTWYQGNFTELGLFNLSKGYYEPEEFSGWAPTLADAVEFYDFGGGDADWFAGKSFELYGYQNITVQVPTLAPTLPAGYLDYRVIGSFATDATSKLSQSLTDYYAFTITPGTVYSLLYDCLVFLTEPGHIYVDKTANPVTVRSASTCYIRKGESFKTDVAGSFQMVR